MQNPDRWSQCIFTQIKRETGALSYFMGVNHPQIKCYEEWLRALRQTADEGRLQSSWLIPSQQQEGQLRTTRMFISVGEGFFYLNFDLNVIINYIV